MGKIFTKNLKNRFSASIAQSLICLNIFLFLVPFSNVLFAEGSKQLIPDPTKNYGQLQIWDNVSTNARVFMTYAATNVPLKRLNIKICNVGEKVYIGFQSQNNDVFLRVKDPNGNSIPLSYVSSVTGLATAAATVNKPKNYTSVYVNGAGTIVNASAAPIPAPNQYTYRVGENAHF